MREYLQHTNVSVVTVILPQQTSRACVESVFACGDQNALLLHGRGTLVRDSWYHSILPILSPEKDLLQFLVPDPQVDFVMERIINSGHLYLPGAGAVFSIPCDEVIRTPEFSLWSFLEKESEASNASINLRENLSAIFCINRPEQTDVISRAALQNGAHGPVVHYCNGRGLRERLGWLRITQKSQKELMTIIADNTDADAIIEAMVEAGRLDMPGRGFLYRMPVNKGLVNIASTYGNRAAGANLKQIVSAIDTLMGDGRWRQQDVIDLQGAGKLAGLSLFSKIKQRPSLSDQIGLGCIVARKHIPVLLDAAIAAGASGAHISNAKFIEAECKKTATGIRLNHEDGIIRIISDRNKTDSILDAMKQAADDEDIRSICFYKQPIRNVVTYLTGSKDGQGQGQINTAQMA